MIAATSGNRTRAARVAGEHSTTEPTLLACSLAIRITQPLAENHYSEICQFITQIQIDIALHLND